MNFVVAPRPSQHGFQRKSKVRARERNDAPPQMNPFAKAQHEAKAERAEDLIFPGVALG